MTDATSLAPTKPHGTPASQSVARTTRSGSEARQKQERVTVRLSRQEHDQLTAAADRAGLTVGSYVRARVLTAPTTRAVRTPPVSKVALSKLLGEIGRIGNNVNQIARRLNSGGDAPEAHDLQATLRGLWQMRDAVLIALGMKADTDYRPASVRRE